MAGFDLRYGNAFANRIVVERGAEHPVVASTDAVPVELLAEWLEASSPEAEQGERPRASEQ